MRQNLPMKSAMSAASENYAMFTRSANLNTDNYPNYARDASYDDHRIFSKTPCSTWHDQCNTCLTPDY